MKKLQVVWYISFGSLTLHFNLSILFRKALNHPPCFPLPESSVFSDTDRPEINFVRFETVGSPSHAISMERYGDLSFAAASSVPQNPLERPTHCLRYLGASIKQRNGMIYHPVNQPGYSLCSINLVKQIMNQRSYLEAPPCSQVSCDLITLSWVYQIFFT